MYVLYEDAGHAWLSVSKIELEKLGIADKISGFSYMKKDRAYLEEDCDLSVFLDAKFKTDAEKKWFMNNEVKSHYNDESIVRKYDDYSISKVVELYEMQILMRTSKGKNWMSVHPTGKPPYQYKTKQEAQDMLDMCYPDVFPEEKRIVKVAV